VEDAQLLRYSRHLLLDEMGVAAQQRLLDACVLVVGAGGLGCPAAQYLAAAGVGHLVLADDDTVDLTNLQRQILHRQDSLGWPKVESARRALNDLNPEVRVSILKHRLQDAELDQAVGQADVVLDCCDNFETRHAINAACVRHRKPLVSGAAIRFDGQLAVYDSRDANCACYHCVFPRSQQVEAVRCATMGVFAPLTGLVGTLQAAEALKILGGFGAPLVSRMLMIDARTMDFTHIQLPRDPRCGVCGSGSPG
jgi:molybdopterin-synthase adenylyltransferase